MILVSVTKIKYRDECILGYKNVCVKKFMRMFSLEHVLENNFSKIYLK
jgi:hypothetical protein